MVAGKRIATFALGLAEALNPLPAPGFLVRRKVGHVLYAGLPKVLEKVAEKTEVQIATKLTKGQRLLLLQGAVRRQKMMATKRRATPHYISADRRIPLAAPLVLVDAGA